MFVEQRRTGIEIDRTAPDPAPAGIHNSDLDAIANQHAASHPSWPNRIRPVSGLNRIDVIRDSLWVFICGLLALLPVVGLFPAIYGLYRGAALWRQSSQEWNPASHYLRCGMVLAVLSLGLSALAGAIVVLQLVPHFGAD
jgi:hypothetical protein